jgi:glutaredoxin
MCGYNGFMNMVVYTKRNCYWCDDLLDFLKENHIDFVEKEVLSNKEFFEEMKSISGQTLAPTVVLGDVVYPDTDKGFIRLILNN